MESSCLLLLFRTCTTPSAESWVQPKLGDDLGFQVQTADESWSVEIRDQKCVQDILRRAKAGQQVQVITDFNEEGEPLSHSCCKLPARLVRFNLDHLGSATAALLLVLSGQAHRVDWDKVDPKQMVDTYSPNPRYTPNSWMVLQQVSKPR